MNLQPNDPATEPVRGQTALPASRELLQGLADTVREPLLILDAGLRVLHANRSFYGAFAVDRGTTEGLLIYDLGNRQWDIPELRRLLEDILPNQSTFDDFAVDHEFERIGRRTMHLNARKVVQDDAPAPLILLAIEDVTERSNAARQLREYEARFRQIFESVKDFSIFATDREGVVTHWNAGAENVFGYREDEIVGRSAAVIFTPEDRARGIPEQEMLNAAQNGHGTDERWHQKKDGSRFYASGMVTPLLDDAGELIGFTKVCRDVTEKKLAHSESQRLAAIVASTDDAIVSKDLDGIITSWNGAAERIFGYSAAEMVGRPIAALIPLELASEEANILAKIRRGERIEHFETRRRTKTGQFIEVSISVSPIRDEKGVVIGASKVARDVTERKRIEEGLAERELRYRLVADAANDAIWDWNLRSNEVTWNEGVRACFGYSADEVRPDASWWVEHIHPDDVERVSGGIHEHIDHGPDAWRDEYRFRRADGTYAEVSDRGRVVRDDGGRAVRMIGSMRDLTERRRAEQALRAAEERFAFVRRSSGVGFWYCDLPFDELQWDELVKGHFHLPADARVTIETFYERIHPEDRAVTRAAIERSIAERAAYDVAYRTVAPATGAETWVRAIGRTFYSDDGTPKRFDGVTLDISEHKRAEAERERLLATTQAARTEAEEANRAKDEFLATLSHELRTPLNAIVGWAKILRSGRCDAEDVAEAIEVIDRNGQAQSRLIEDLLDVSRITTGNLRLEVQRLNIAEVIETALAAVAPAAAAKEIRLLKTLDSLVGPVSGDFARLQQVIWNLLTNAVKFTPKGGKVQLLLERVNSHIEVCVIDTGMGIGPEFLPHVFDRFRQADASTTRRHGGLGLGLSIVKHLVEMHGGSIRAKSPGEGQGSTFIVALPITVVHPERPDSPRVSPKEEAAGGEEDFCQGGALVGLKVLVVDDEPDARQMLRRVLADCEAEVEIAGSADEALERLRGFRPDVIVSDVGMPGQDGYDLIRKVRETIPAKQVPAIALTAFARPEDRKRAMLAGFQSHVAKPVDPAELTAVVASLAGRTG